MLKIFDKGLRLFCLFLIYCYRSFFRLWLSGGCRYEPSCSEYGKQAFRRFSFFKAFYYTTTRILRCRPGAGYGPDPLPKEILNG